MCPTPYWNTIRETDAATTTNSMKLLFYLAGLAIYTLTAFAVIPAIVRLFVRTGGDPNGGDALGIVLLTGILVLIGFVLLFAVSLPVAKAHLGSYLPSVILLAVSIAVNGGIFYFAEMMRNRPSLQEVEMIRKARVQTQIRDLIREMQLQSTWTGEAAQQPELPIERLPHTDSTNFDNFHTACPLGSRDIFNMGLSKKAAEHPEAKIYLHYLLLLSEDYMTLVLVYEYEHELFSEMVNLDTQGAIIDAIHIAYDEIAESATRLSAEISAGEVETLHINYLNEPAEQTRTSYRITPEGRFELIGEKE